MSKKPLEVRCPRCSKTVQWHASKYRPFCSEKCRLIDLGRWADEDYRIAGKPVPPADDES